MGLGETETSVNKCGKHRVLVLRNTVAVGEDLTTVFMSLGPMHKEKVKNLELLTGEVLVNKSQWTILVGFWKCRILKKKKCKQWREQGISLELG